MIKDISVTCEDSTHLTATLYTPKRAIKGAVMIAPATGIKRQFYAAFANYLCEQGFGVIVAGAGGAAHLPGMVAALTTLPVIGVPVKSRALSGVDSLHSIVQMPGGIPVATMAIGDAGATNAGLFAVAMLARHDESLAATLTAFRAERAAQVRSIELEH